MSRFIPIAEELILKKGLYEKITLGDVDYDVADEIFELEFFNKPIRTYCQDCQQESSFRRNQLIDGTVLSLTSPHVAHQYSNLIDGMKTYNSVRELKEYIERHDEYAFADKTFTLEFYCTHNHNHRIFYTFNIQNKILQKIGQFPSVADSMEVELKVYKKALEKELSKEKSQEFSKAVGLYSHGVGIGSFVYLRRIFESFIYQAKDEAILNGGITIEEFNSCRMVEKIELLSDILPDIIVENKVLYGVVSKGIHELSEEECREYFNIIKNGIELILDEKIAKRKAEEKREKFTRELSKAHQEIIAIDKV